VEGGGFDGDQKESEGADSESEIVEQNLADGESRQKRKSPLNEGSPNKRRQQGDAHFSSSFEFDETPKESPPPAQIVYESEIGDDVWYGLFSQPPHPPPPTPPPPPAPTSSKAASAGYTVLQILEHRHDRSKTSQRYTRVNIPIIFYDLCLSQRPRI
jgi:hypothetical protein